MPITNVAQTSLINLFPEITDDDNIKILDIWNSFRFRVIPDAYKSDAYIEYTPKSTDTLFMLSYNNYATTALWWVIPLVNDAEDPFDFLKNVVDNAGTIKILRNSYIPGILFYVGRIKNAKDNK